VCNLYSQARSREEVARLFRISPNRIGAVPVQPAIFPGWDAPVVRLTEVGERECVTMNWGFVLPQVGKVPRRITNIRDDKILESRVWRPLF
jgi:putative SOS response-associated peptidase YedK